MRYAFSAIADAQVPRAKHPAYQHILDTYASETNKVASVWVDFSDADLSFRPHAKSSTVLDIMKHQLLSERRFFWEVLGSSEPKSTGVFAAQLSFGKLRVQNIQEVFPPPAVLAARKIASCPPNPRFFY